MKTILFLLLLPQLVLAQETLDVSKIADIKDSLEEGGSWLIYYCAEKHWGCVSKEAFHECRNLQGKDDFNPERELSSCVPLGELPSKRGCEQRVQYLTTHNYGARFCIKDQWKNKAIDF